VPPPTLRRASLRRAAATALAAAALALALAPARLARAAPCCISATSFGVGRLLIWEDFAVGVQLGHTRYLGEYDASGALRLHPAGYHEGLSQLQPWAIVRVNKRVQVEGWVPLLLNDRTSDGTRQIAGGLGDVGAAGRFELIGIGEVLGFPSLAVTLGATAPTGRRVEQTSPPLFAGTTGRGAWAGSIAVESEYARMPWFMRLDAGASFSLPFTRPDTGQRQLYGPVGRVGLSAGREIVRDVAVLALAATSEIEGSTRLDGAVAPSSVAYSLSLAASLSWRVGDHWTLVGGLNNSVWPSHFAKNRDAQIGLTFGARYGHF
jgi:hypothetical protein